MIAFPNKFTVFLPDGLKNSFIFNNTTGIEKIYGLLQTYRSTLDLNNYYLIDCDDNVIPFDSKNKICDLKEPSLYLIEKEPRYKILEIHSIDFKRR
jgi:hypothetical protein